MSRKELLPLLFVILVLLVGIAGYLFFLEPLTESELNPLGETQIKESPRVISCHPNSYNQYPGGTSFPCNDNARPVDIERERKARQIIARAYSNTDDRASFFIVSSNRYQLFQAEYGPYIVVDTILERIADHFRPIATIERSPSRIIYLDTYLGPNDTMVEESVHLYLLGSKKQILISGSQIRYPETYFSFRARRVVASTTVTLSVHDLRKPVEEPSSYYLDLEKIGDKTLILPNPL